MSRQERLAAQVAARIAGCPDAEDLQRLHEGAAAPREAEEIGVHLRFCGACLKALEHLRAQDLDETHAPVVEPPAEVTRRSDSLIEAAGRPASSRAAFSRTSMLRFAAGLVLAGSLSAAGYLWWAGRMDPVREPFGDLGVFRGEAPLEPFEPIGALAEAPSTMRWAPHPQAGTYQVILFDGEMNKVWTRETPDANPVLMLDGPTREALAAGGRFTWQVVAVGRLGQAMGRSPAAQFTIVSAGPTR